MPPLPEEPQAEPQSESENQAIPEVAEQTPQRRGHTRRPPLAEVDTWELWQAWRQGDRERVMPWLGLLASFCMVLAAMYAFFFFSTTLTGDTLAMVLLSVVFVAFLSVLWRRISPRRGFSLAIVGSIVLVSGLAFFLWLALCSLSGWNTLVGIGGSLILGLGGLLAGLPALNAIARMQDAANGNPPA
jgi:drug/metabolite transporter (DMT)-like permease